MSTITAVVLVAVVLFAWFSIFKVVPASLLSLYRYRLWRLRDTLADEIRDGEYDDLVQPRRLLSAVEAFIGAAPVLSPLNMVLLRLSMSGVDDPPDETPFSLEGLSKRDKDRLVAHCAEFHQATALKVLLGTPSGWIVLVVAIPIFVVVALLSELLRLGAGTRGLLQSVGKEVSRESFPLVTNQSHSSPLSQHGY